jgi:hypothetical protein
MLKARRHEVRVYQQRQGAERMIYIKVKWSHSFPDEPILLYSELDRERCEIRKVEAFPGGRMGYAGLE